MLCSSVRLLRRVKILWQSKSERMVYHRKVWCAWVELRITAHARTARFPFVYNMPDISKFWDDACTPKALEWQISTCFKKISKEQVRLVVAELNPAEPDVESFDYGKSNATGPALMSLLVISFPEQAHLNSMYVDWHSCRSCSVYGQRCQRKVPHQCFQCPIPATIQRPDSSEECRTRSSFVGHWSCGGQEVRYRRWSQQSFSDHCVFLLIWSLLTIDTRLTYL